MSDVEAGAVSAAPEPAAIAPTQTAEPVNTMDALTQTMSAAYDKINPPREEGGQFAAKEPAEGADQSDAAAETTDQAQKEGSEPEPPAIAPPNSWSAEMKAKFASLPPDVQAYAAQRESDAHKQISQLGQTVKTLGELFEPLRQVCGQKGVSERDGLGFLLNAHSRLESNPVEAIAWLAQSYGVDLRQYVAQNGGDQSAYARSLVARAERAERTAQEALNRLNAREHSEMERARASLISVIEDFAKDKPDFAELENDVLIQVQAIRSAEPSLEPNAVLAKAYEAARWANPQVRTRLLDAQRQEAETKRVTEAKKKADEAKKAGSLNVKSAHGSSPARKGSWEETLREVGERLAS